MLFLECSSEGQLLPNVGDVPVKFGPLLVEHHSDSFWGGDPLIFAGHFKR